MSFVLRMRRALPSCAAPHTPPHSSGKTNPLHLVAAVGLMTKWPPCLQRTHWRWKRGQRKKNRLISRRIRVLTWNQETKWAFKKPRILKLLELSAEVMLRKSVCVATLRESVALGVVYLQNVWSMDRKLCCYTRDHVQLDKYPPREKCWVFRWIIRNVWILCDYHRCWSGEDWKEVSKSWPGMLLG